MLNAEPEPVFPVAAELDVALVSTLFVDDVPFTEPVVTVSLSYVWECDGKFLVCNVTVELPPVVPTVYDDEYPNINFPLRSGVSLLPSHNTQPLGIFDVDPLHATIIPDGNTAFEILSIILDKYDDSDTVPISLYIILYPFKESP